MAVGQQPNVASINQQLTALSTQLRNTMQAIANAYNEVTDGGTGIGNLESFGFSSADATLALNAYSYMNTVAGVYYGTVQQGGTGGTGAATFNFNQALAPLWACQ